MSLELRVAALEAQVALIAEQATQIARHIIVLAESGVGHQEQLADFTDALASARERLLILLTEARKP